MRGQHRDGLFKRSSLPWSMFLLLPTLLLLSSLSGCAGCDDADSDGLLASRDCDDEHDNGILDDLESHCCAETCRSNPDASEACRTGIAPPGDPNPTCGGRLTGNTDPVRRTRGDDGSSANNGGANNGGPFDGHPRGGGSSSSSSFTSDYSFSSDFTSSYSFSISHTDSTWTSGGSGTDSTFTGADGETCAVPFEMFADGDSDGFPNCEAIQGPPTLICNLVLAHGLTFLRADGLCDCDDDDPTVTRDRSWQYDGDHDGYVVDNAMKVNSCMTPTSGTGDWHLAGTLPEGDCDDGNFAVHPSAAQICGMDANCDGMLDRFGEGSVWVCDDNDHDGVPNLDACVPECFDGTGIVVTDPEDPNLKTDCNDEEPRMALAFRRSAMTEMVRTELTSMRTAQGL